MAPLGEVFLSELDSFGEASDLARAFSTLAD